MDRRLKLDIFKALADPARATIWSCLLKCSRPCSVKKIAACCALDYSVVARHVATLARAGLGADAETGAHALVHCGGGCCR